jgi:hypothetical protein
MHDAFPMRALKDSGWQCDQTYFGQKIAQLSFFKGTQEEKK